MIPVLIAYIVLIVLMGMFVWWRLRLLEPPISEKSGRAKVADFFAGIFVLVGNVICFSVFLSVLYAVLYSSISSEWGFIGLTICFVTGLIFVGAYLKKIKKYYILAGMITGIVAPFVLFGFCFLMFIKF